MKKVKTNSKELLYYDKVKGFNIREDYSVDVKIAKLLLNYCCITSARTKIFIIGTGLGADAKIVKGVKNLTHLTGIEPRPLFYKEASKIYKQIGGNLLNMKLGEFVKQFHYKLSGIFLFIHSINHISRKELVNLGRSMTNSFVIVVNPNPQLVKMVGKTDTTVISYLTRNRIERILNCETLLDSFYHPIKIRGKKIFLREAMVLKSKA